jgi:hypothetical protein
MMRRVHRLNHLNRDFVFRVQHPGLHDQVALIGVAHLASGPINGQDVKSHNIHASQVVHHAPPVLYAIGSGSHNHIPKNYIPKNLWHYASWARALQNAAEETPKPWQSLTTYSRIPACTSVPTDLVRIVM